MKQNSKVIAFDFDGTLADTMPIVLKVFNTLGPRFGLSEITAGQLEAMRGKSAHALFKHFGISPLKLPSLYSAFKKEFALYSDAVNLFPGIKETLMELDKTYTLGIVTSNAKENVEMFLKKNDLSVFDFIYSDKSIFGKGKIIKQLLKKYAFEQQHFTYVGDEVRDIDAARQAGVKIVSVSWGFNTREVLEKNNPDALVDTPDAMFHYFH